MKKGFTLAEVLITLAIIGVVAALTIPTVMASYQKHSQYTAFMKMYNTVSNALSLSEAENGTPDVWSYDRSNRIESFKKYLFPYLKIATVCENSNCNFDYEYSMLVPSSGESMPASEVIAEEDGAVILQDGSLLTFNGGGSDTLGYVNFIFDTNGSKGPNVVGRDLFVLYYEKDRDSGKWDFDFQDYSGDTYCDPKGDEYAQTGMGCAGRLLEKGKMDY